MSFAFKRELTLILRSNIASIVEEVVEECSVVLKRFASPFLELGFSAQVCAVWSFGSQEKAPHFLLYFF